MLKQVSHSLHPLFSEKKSYFVQLQVLELLPMPAPTQTLHHLPVEDPGRVLHRGSRSITPDATFARRLHVRLEIRHHPMSERSIR